MSRPDRQHHVSGGHYLTLDQAADANPAFTVRLLRRLVQERRIPFSRAGRRIVIAQTDIDTYLEANRVEPSDSKRASLSSHRFN